MMMTFFITWLLTELTAFMFHFPLPIFFCLFCLTSKRKKVGQEKEIKSGKNLLTWLILRQKEKCERISLEI